MNTARLAATGAAAMLALTGFAHAAAGPLQVPAALVASHPPAAAIQVVNGPAAVAYSRSGNIVAVADMGTPSVRSARVEAPGKGEPIYSIETRKASETPLPGALWLFGSALLAFLGISARRRF